jgi:hypothetical protein
MYYLWSNWSSVECTWRFVDRFCYYAYVETSISTHFTTHSFFQAVANTRKHVFFEDVAY